KFTGSISGNTITLNVYRIEWTGSFSSACNLSPTWNLTMTRDYERQPDTHGTEPDRSGGHDRARPSPYEPVTVPPRLPAQTPARLTPSLGFGTSRTVASETACFTCCSEIRRRPSLS